MPSKIRILSDQTINQIAAGEVIENPASVVKELVENAVDAGARHVTIEILGGGFQLIKISDDGSGMSPDDAVLCLERHATSKITGADDLFSLTTMGFRGEALASIAAISKTSLFSALEGSPAVNLEVEGGKIAHVGPAARARGTTIEVRSLFYNVPARKKFQKSPAASSAEITKVVTQLALAHPEVGFELIQQNRSHFNLPASGGEDFLTLLKTRADALLGSDFLPSCRPFELNEKSCEGKGLIADPLFSRHNRSGQYLFVNRRPVVCFPISYAVRDAYGTRLGSDRHPVYLLHLFLSPELVDVNVHPQKREVRLREESMLKYALHGAVNSALGGVETPSPAAAPPEGRDFSSFFSQPSYPDFSEPLTLKEEEGPPPSQELNFENPIQLVGLHGRYLLVEAASLPAVFFADKQRARSGVVWIDLPASEARVQFDALLKNAEEVPVSQGLLLPATVNFSRAEAQLLQAHLDTVQKLGLQVREAGDAAFLIEGVPPFINASDVRPVLMEMIGELQNLEREKTRSESALRRLAAHLSRASRSRGQYYQLEEARQIVEKLMKTGDPLHCPQGKRTAYHVTEDEIESYFTAKHKTS
ncbi:MAG: DNA mismatch repair endonuclease MutL [Verrucomicrobia bacterium]|nr:DNA mismatch repair endonuclease MutL [Verrucomicrobiota bacterium]